MTHESSKNSFFQVQFPEKTFRNPLIKKCRIRKKVTGKIPLFSGAMNEQTIPSKFQRKQFPVKSSKLGPFNQIIKHQNRDLNKRNFKNH